MHSMARGNGILSLTVVPSFILFWPLITLLLGCNSLARLFNLFYSTLNKAHNCLYCPSWICWLKQPKDTLTYNKNLTFAYKHLMFYLFFLCHRHLLSGINETVVVNIFVKNVLITLCWNWCQAFFFGDSMIQWLHGLKFFETGNVF